MFQIFSSAGIFGSRSQSISHMQLSLSNLRTTTSLCQSCPSRARAISRQHRFSADTTNTMSTSRSPLLIYSVYVLNKLTHSHIPRRGGRVRVEPDRASSQKYPTREGASARPEIIKLVLTRPDSRPDRASG